MPAMREAELVHSPPLGAPKFFPMPLLSSRPLAWKGIILDVYRAREVNFLAAHFEHVVSAQLKGCHQLLQNTAPHASRKIVVGKINITPAGVSRHWRYEAETEIAVLRISPSLLESVTADENGLDPVKLAVHSDVRDAQIEYLTARLLDELRADGLASRMCAQLLANLLGIHLLRHYSKGRIVAQPPSGKLPGHKLRRATDYIKGNLRNDLSLVKISETLCMSPSHFAHVFKQTTGLAPHRYVIECRMEKAKSLLRETNLRINEIAQMVGYPSQSHFSMVFRQLTGQSPLRYRDDA